MLIIDFIRWETIYINGIKTKYQISNFGEVRTKKKLKRKKNVINKYGYVQIQLCVNGKPVTVLVHRLVALAFVKNPDPDKFNEVNHINGKKQDNYYGNLEWTDRSGNIKHAYDNALRTQNGEDNPHHKYTTKQIVKVCKMLQKGFSVKEISKKTKVSKRTIYHVKYREKWKHISKDYDF